MKEEKEEEEEEEEGKRSIQSPDSRLYQVLLNYTNYTVILYKIGYQCEPDLTSSTFEVKSQASHRAGGETGDGINQRVLSRI